MKSPRRGWGQQKVNNLLNRLGKYYLLYSKEDNNFLSYPLATVKSYIEMTEGGGIAIQEIKQKFQKLNNLSQIGNVDVHAGVYEETKQNVLSRCNRDFESLLYSRHSIRYFTDKIPDIDLIRRALELAQRTPSACNRQGWATHVFFGGDSVKLMKCQEGCRDFEVEIKCAILVTAKLKAFLNYEIFQAYVDGGLYAMNLINALHSLGLGTFRYRQLLIVIK